MKPVWWDYCLDIFKEIDSWFIIKHNNDGIHKKSTWAIGRDNTCYYMYYDVVTVNDCQLTKGCDQDAWFGLERVQSSDQTFEKLVGRWKAFLLYKITSHRIQSSWPQKRVYWIFWCLGGPILDFIMHLCGMNLGYLWLNNPLPKCNVPCGCVVHLFSIWCCLCLCLRSYGAYDKTAPDTTAITMIHPPPEIPVSRNFLLIRSSLEVWAFR